MPTAMLHPAGLRDISDAASLLAEGFATDPLWNLLLGPSRTRDHSMMFAEAWIRAGLAAGEVLLDSTRSSVSVWILPALEHQSVEPKMRAAADLQKLVGERHRQASRLEAQLMLFRPQRSVIHLGMLAVNGADRRKGLGWMHLEHGRQRGLEFSSPIYLETSNRAAISLYAKFGFTSLGSCEFDTIGSHIECMLLALPPETQRPCVSS